MDLKELEKLAKLCKKYGITSVKMAEVEISIDIYSLPPTQMKAIDSEPSSKASEASNTITEEDILMWSSSGV